MHVYTHIPPYDVCSILIYPPGPHVQHRCRSTDHHVIALPCVCTFLRLFFSSRLWGRRTGLSRQGIGQMPLSPHSSVPKYTSLHQTKGKDCLTLFKSQSFASVGAAMRHLG